MDKETLGYLKLSNILTVLNKVQAAALRESINDPDISFEFLIGTFFPKVLDNIQNCIKDSYTQGYIDGLNEAKGTNNEN